MNPIDAVALIESHPTVNYVVCTSEGTWCYNHHSDPDAFNPYLPVTDFNQTAVEQAGTLSSLMMSRKWKIVPDSISTAQVALRKVSQ